MGKVNSKQGRSRKSKSKKESNSKYLKASSASSFTAEGENCKAEMVILYEPGIEVFLSCLHPKGSLYEKTTTRKKVKESYNNFCEELKKHSITVHNVRDVLKLNPQKLKDLASKSLKYQYIGNINGDDIISDDIKEEEEELERKYNMDKYINDNYKMHVLDELDNDDLVDIILCQPVIEISSCDINTGVNIEYIKLKPVGNLVFCRDQQITTNKGVIIGHLNSSQRKFETEIMKLVFENLDINIIGCIPNNCHLEGGDFIPINKNLSLLGIGLRTDFEAAQYLMDNDLIGTDKFALIIDENDKNQDRMHLDTVFNVLNHNTMIVLDFDSIPHDKSIDISRKVNIYKKNKFKNNKYELIDQGIDFYQFLENEGFNIIKVTHEQQLKYIINFLNIGNGNIISVNKDLKKLINDYNNFNNSKINVEYIEFDGIKSMYGAAHCATQVSRFNTSSDKQSSSYLIHTKRDRTNRDRTNKR